VMKAVAAQIEKVRAEGITDEELTKGKNQLLRNTVTQTLTAANKATMLGQAAVLEGDLSRVNRQFDDIRAVTQDDVNSSPLGYASENEESEYGGLAYARSDPSDNDEPLARETGRSRTSGRVRRGLSISSTYSNDQPPAEQTSVELGIETAMAALLQSPTSSDTPLSPKSPIAASLPRSLKIPTRSLTSPAHAARDSSSTVGGGFIARRGGTISGAIGGSSDQSKKDRLSQESSASGLDRHRENVLTCVRCSKDIEDKRWIRVENGRGVLCDKCWKNMYLPKV